MTVTPNFRFRRLRRTPVLRALTRQVHCTANDLILPLFIEEGITEKVAIASMPGVYRIAESDLAERVKQVWNNGVKAVILFGVSHQKDASGSDSWDAQGLLARCIKIAREAVPEMLVISDNCFCEYTDHGHCGVVVDGDVDNDATLVNLQKQVLSCARAGVDMIAPSGMMDGMIAAIRQALDAEGFTHIPIMSYSTKFASAFYGPFREAVDSSFKGSRNSYQQDPANPREALAESMQDEAEGADILMVKPGLAYLDVIANISQHSSLPMAVYQVSGEFAMIKAAANAGVIDEKAVVLETMTAFKRAGCDLIITYYAEDLVQWLK
ncbi:MAG: HemB protein [Osedax symbiont Rs1]|nr:MAG: HemB protein [Osedax symbiont Rs1]